MLSLFYRHDDTNIYHSKVREFFDWCDTNHLLVNVQKTEEIITNSIFWIFEVQSHKYLGVYTDNIHVDCSPLLQRMYFLHRLGLYGVESFCFIRLFWKVS